jgi:hypothetical protein
VLAIARGTVPPASVVQGDLARAGVPLVWFDDLPVDHTDFAAIQWTAVRGLYPLGAGVHASSDAPISRAEAAIALTGLPRERAIEQGWMATDHRN